MNIKLEMLHKNCERETYESVGDEVAENTQCLHADDRVAVGEKAEDVVRSEKSHDLVLRALVAVKRHILKSNNKTPQLM